MADVTNIKPIVKEDYPSKYHDLIDRLSFSLNPFMRQVVTAFSGQIDESNLTFKIIDFTTIVDVSGVPTSPLLIKNDSTRRFRGFICINAENLTDSTTITGAPFFVFTANTGVITVTKITGLPADKKFRLTVVIFR